MKSLLIGTSFIVLLSLPLSGCSKSKGASGDGSESGVGVQDLELANQQRYGQGNIPLGQEGGAYPDIHFDYDSSQVPTESLGDIKRLADAMTADRTIHAEVEGHCDQRGTNEYNYALGQERAKAVAKVLSSYGVQSDQMSTISYGEEIPLEAGTGEDAFAKNRRAHFALFRKGEGNG